MSNPYEREAEDRYEAQNDSSPVSGTVRDNTYAHETRSELRSQIPVQKDEDVEEDPIQPPFSNSTQQLENDEREAIDRSNILRGDRLRHAKPRTQDGYSEGRDEDDLPEDVRYGQSGRSATGGIF
ncbi:hypothetical protein BDV32DRAFT_156030 [Aspergillus pseudonomiae]|uniref:Histone chaperone domain-containing protein n=2 Tax=Aspergillus subgen. Circumdati TaxID=2720871 RepID=A0A0L1IKW1_ASPN3|nr:uncharacterized protein ANOM_011523 [Aspergillus nomiae NRRL 13137]XP_031937106.1 uncharacterized protein BDV37DRAFT_220634 [Aspergillus pseudonomiae]KAB8253567.1 hypothetical protein BDV32DRAFT_156030 [Aspergillus pseudonomiae]KAE8399787.1 hypothetical protein BDV37DRAFT_220634 [Aspergillus pseudonomiae]KNG80204.1 hypothetical protein ANOM_011523 [Aspergillus nomiae NRRL 13137]